MSRSSPTSRRSHLGKCPRIWCGRCIPQAGFDLFASNISAVGHPAFWPWRFGCLTLSYHGDLDVACRPRPFVSASVRQNIISLQILLGTIAVPLILLSAITVERQLAEESLRRSRNRLIDSQEQERHRIARELHDDIGQQLTLVGLELDQTRNSEPTLPFRSRLDRL